MSPPIQLRLPIAAAAFLMWLLHTGTTMTWKRALLIVGAALILWLRPWRRLLKRPAPGPAGPGRAHAPAAAPEWSPVPEVLPVPPLSAASDELAETATVPPEEAFGAAMDDEPPAEDVSVDLVAAPVAADDMAPEAAFPTAVAADDVAPEAAFPSAEELDAALNVGEAAGDELDAALIELGEPEPVEMAEDDLVEEPTSQAVGAAPAQPDDLLVIEGIGPRVSTIVTAAGITTFADLAAAEVERLRTILVDAGFKTVDPATWPEQARIAAEGRWDDLRELQRNIKDGKKK
jgi:predicted flap endonuclease-1-like 5' DNA nuclease